MPSLVSKHTYLSKLFLLLVVLIFSFFILILCVVYKSGGIPFVKKQLISAQCRLSVSPICLATPLVGIKNSLSAMDSDFVTTNRYKETVTYYNLQSGVLNGWSLFVPRKFKINPHTSFNVALDYSDKDIFSKRIQKAVTDGYLYRIESNLSFPEQPSTNIYQIRSNFDDIDSFMKFVKPGDLLTVVYDKNENIIIVILTELAEL